MGSTGGVESALGIKDVLPPGLVETNADIVRAACDRSFTSRTKSPRSQESRTVGNIEPVVMRGGRQGAGIPPTGVQVEGVTIASKPSREIANICFRPTASR